ncbi:MAG: translation elongation factor Ts [Patescibacteria group bacterium]|jgi:elongation factor Ts|nr:translation elongation factor Ts [Patescibacteria group bacterium]
MAVNLDDITKLREMTGVGMMDCKKALEEANGNFEKAIELLRKKGAATAAKRAGREANQGLIVSYLHNNRIGALLELNSETDFVARNEDFKNLANELVMHVAASAPLYVSREDVPKDLVDKEREIEAAKIENEKKPKEIVEKILDGKMNKYFSTICLLEQPYIKNPDITIQDLLDEKTAAIGEKLVIKRFARFELGN